MCIISSFVINWRFRRIDQNGSHKPVYALPPSSCIYNSHIIEKRQFFAYFMHILNSCVVWQTANLGRPPSQPHNFSAGLLFDEEFGEPDVFEVVNCPVVALSVLYSTVLMRGVIFLQFWTSLAYSTECDLLSCFNGLPDIFAVMRCSVLPCSVLALSAVFYSGLLTRSAENLYLLR